MVFNIKPAGDLFIVESDQPVPELSVFGEKRNFRLTSFGALAREGGTWTTRADAEAAIKRFNIMAGK
jgi:hypothetical protein